ncbi:zinc finger HIT domain-containing protein 2 [Danaus plexippus]|uniref:zinc finger HIT domain-containing protein 2 n=1 Tax=Danaus plexippus TaxID=13037 RepID=UPI002AB0395F|nr:zinc finger HIT domain-containing protein 2 [Danaus plexippus]
MSSQPSKRIERLCGLCENNSSKYCCPRCEVFYCSLDCYKSEKHLECSENFYRECVNQELASNTADDEAKNKMIDILKRMHNESFDNDLENIEEPVEIDSDDDSEIDLHTRIKDLNLDDPDALWNALTSDEKNEFEAMLSQGDVGTIIPQWQPWWLFRKEKKLVEEVDLNGEKEALERCPTIKTVPKFSSLTSIQPSPSIRFNMVNIIAAYAFAIRYVNGEINHIEICTYILEVCSNLKTNTNFEDAELAIESVAQMCIQNEYIDTDEASLNVMRHDTFLILQGPSEENHLHYSKTAFSHLLDIFIEAKTQKKRNKPKESKTNGNFSRKFPQYNKSHLPDIDTATIKKVIKKLEYYLAYLESCNNKAE